MVPRCPFAPPLPPCFHLTLKGRAGILVKLVLSWPSPAPLISQRCILPPPSVLSPALEHPPCEHPPSTKLWSVTAPVSICLAPSSRLDQLMWLFTRQILVGLVQPEAWHQVNACQASPAQNWADAHQAGPAWTLALGRWPLRSGLDQPSEHPARLASSSCAHTGSHPLSAGAVSSWPWQAASRHHGFLLNNTSHLRACLSPKLHHYNSNWLRKLGFVKAVQNLLGTSWFWPSQGWQRFLLSSFATICLYAGIRFSWCV